MTEKKCYDCDTSSYWCSESDYHDSSRKFGAFIDDGAAYRIDDKHTPRPWLNYFAGRDFGSVISNTGLGFTWFRSPQLSITRYEHPGDYLPREFNDGRKIILHDLDSDRRCEVFGKDAALTCVHHPGFSTFTTVAFGLEVGMTVFVPTADNCEIWLINIDNPARQPRRVELSCEQIWSFTRSGADAGGISRRSVPGQSFRYRCESNRIFCETDNPDLPVPLFGFFLSPQAGSCSCLPLPELHQDAQNRKFVFHLCRLHADLEIPPAAGIVFEVIAAAAADRAESAAAAAKYRTPGTAAAELEKVIEQRTRDAEKLYCEIPDKNVQHFLNYWLKNQLYLTFRFCRSGQHSYHDSLQNLWGYIPIDPAAAEERLCEILAHQFADGSAPRAFSAFPDGRHDCRRYMDSPVWIPAALNALVRETGNFAILDRRTPFLNGGDASVAEHALRALAYLFEHRGANGCCLTGDGDWNETLENISRDSDAESFRLTIALYDAMLQMAELLRAAKRREPAAALEQQAATLKTIVNNVAWDGEWYRCGVTGKGLPIGSATCDEGKIHLNAQTWAVFSGLAPHDRAVKAMNAVEKYLRTPFGTALLWPPYVHAATVGRIANLEPGTFENGSVCPHAAASNIQAWLRMKNPDRAFDTLTRLLPTNPENFDCRRTSEPYCTGNFYCGPSHPRAGQNFFTWFTGDVPWLLRAGFDSILGVKAGFNGLEINPRVPRGWGRFLVNRLYRGCLYRIRFEPHYSIGNIGIFVDGKTIESNVIPPQRRETVSVMIIYPQRKPDPAKAD